MISGNKSTFAYYLSDNFTLI